MPGCSHTFSSLASVWLSVATKNCIRAFAYHIFLHRLLILRIPDPSFNIIDSYTPRDNSTVLIRDLIIGLRGHFNSGIGAGKPKQPMKRSMWIYSQALGSFSSTVARVVKEARTRRT
ncbi:hypothetical protein BX600DRAFT_438278 [Xylariales sp. PMI_506]|nr:hypothetical protein BX600DRAFT_438278 [Xylariales sp. PMI_506]